MNILLLGKNGQLGWELHRALQPLGKVFAIDYPTIDMAKKDSISSVVNEFKPQLIVNATAYTAVDKAENEQELAEAVNGIGPRFLAKEAKKTNAFLIHYSTDYVFDGLKGSPYTETDHPNPINTYGLSKLHGDNAIQEIDCNYLIFRTSWVYSHRGDNFVTKVLKWAKDTETLKIVDDQISNPTSSRMLAEISSQLISRGLEYLVNRKGLYHLAGDGYVNRFNWAKEIINIAMHDFNLKNRSLNPVSSLEFPTTAKRPLFTALDCTKFKNTFGIFLPNWKTALDLTLNEDLRYLQNQ